MYPTKKLLIDPRTGESHLETSMDHVPDDSSFYSQLREVLPKAIKNSSQMLYSAGQGSTLEIRLKGGSVDGKAPKIYTTNEPTDNNIGKASCYVGDPSAATTTFTPAPNTTTTTSHNITTKQLGIGRAQIRIGDPEQPPSTATQHGIGRASLYVGAPEKPPVSQNAGVQFSVDGEGNRLIKIRGGSPESQFLVLKRLMLQFQGMCDKVVQMKPAQ